MRYTEKDIPNIALTTFMAALDEKPVKAFQDMKLYYTPYRDDPEPMLVIVYCSQETEPVVGGKINH